MPRIACLRVRDLPLVALLRLEPELRGVPFAVVSGRGPRSVVEAVSTEAAAAGVRGGMTAAQARAVCPIIIIRPVSATATNAAVEAIADVATTVGPRVEIDGDRAVFLDCTGTSALCASEAELATILTARADRHGIPVCVGIGGSKLAARIAAHATGGTRIVPHGGTRAYFAPLPVFLLDPDAETTATLHTWGIERIGDLAALPTGAAAHRLGPAGARLIRRARGEDDEPLRCRSEPVAFAEGTELEYALDHLEPLLFLLRRLVDRMIERFALHGLVCERCELTLALEGGGRDLRRVSPAAPTADGKVLLMLLRAEIEQRPPAHGIVGLTLRGLATRLRPTQLDFFQPSGPSPEALAATIARLATLCGADRVGRPLAPHSHRTDAPAIAAFANVPTAASPATTPWSPDEAAARPRIALRAFRPPMVLDVFHSGGRLDYVRGRGLGGRVVHLAGPWQLRGEWWTADPYAREYFDVELTDGGVYRIYHDLAAQRWLADGAYD